MLERQSHLIEIILPAREFSIIGGPSGSGKTTFLFQFLQSWSRGEPQWNYKSYPVPYLYISGDRSGAGILRTFERMHIDPKSIPHFAAFDDPSLTTINEVLLKAAEIAPAARLYIIEGIAGMVPGNKINDYGAIKAFAGFLGQWCKSKDCTIIGVMHSAKTKANESYENPRQRLLGSVGWGAFSETIICIEPIDAKDPECQLRRLYLLPRNAPEQKFDLEWQDGLLVPASADTMATKKQKGKRGRQTEILRDTLSDIQAYLKHEKIATIKFGELLTHFDPIPSATLNRAIRTLIESGFLRVIRKGEYETVIFKDPLAVPLHKLPRQTTSIVLDEEENEECNEITPPEDDFEERTVRII